jgi:hypothetical protein
MFVDIKIVSLLLRLQNMALYDEKTADKLQEQYGLANTTIRVWKYRNKIPDRYLKADKYELPPIASRAKVQLIAAYLELPYINRNGFAPVRNFRLRDMLKDDKHARFTKAEAKIFLSAVKNLRSKATAAEAKDLAALSDFLNNPAIRPLIFVGDYKLYNRIRQGAKNLQEADWAALLPKLHDFLSLDKSKQDEPSA